jgi:tetratricopeptide (TPR) repeat protein
LSGVLLGRDPEFRILGRSLSDVASGKGEVVLISGEPGIGKTSLLDELRVRAEACGFLVSYIRCAPQGLAGVDSPWRHIVRALLASAPPTEIDPQWRIDCPMFTSPDGTPGEGSPSSDKCIHCLRPGWWGDSEPRHSIRRLFEIVSRVHPLLVILDDLHNADECSLELLHLASDGVRDMRVLIVGAYSVCGMPVGSLTRSTVESIRRSARHMELAPLEPAMTGDLLTQLLGDGRDESLIRHVHDLTGGNPGLILETVYGSLKEAGTNSLDAVRVKVPSAIRAVIEERLAALSPEAIKLLGVASAIGDTFETELVLRVAHLGRAQALFALTELEDAGLVRPAAEQQYRLVNGFLKKVLYEQLPTTARATLHRQLANALEGQDSHNIESHADDIARHLLASRDAGAIQRAMDLAEISARHRACQRDFRKAAEMYSLALDAIDLGGRPDETRRCDILTRLGDAQNQAGDLGAAHATICRAAEIGQRLGDWLRLAEIVLAAPTPHPLSGSPNELVIMFAEKVLGSLQERDVAQRALVMARLAVELSYIRTERERSEQLVAHALEIAQGIESDHQSMLRILRLRDHVLRSPELAHERLANSAERTRIARQQGDCVALFEAEWAREMSLLQLGEIESADAELEPLEFAAVAAGPASRCLVLALRGSRAVSEGRFAEGEELYTRCREMASACGRRELSDELWPALIMPLDEQGRLAELEPAARGCLRMHPHSAVLRAMLCWVALKLGKRSEAKFYLGRLAADGFADLKCSTSLLVGAAALAEVCTELGDEHDHAAMLYELLLPYSKHNVALGAGMAFGAASRYLGKLAVILSRTGEAIEHLQAAIEFNNRIGARAWAAYASHELAVALLVQGQPADRRRALQLLANAHAEATVMRMERLARSIKARVERIEVVEADFIVEGGSNAASICGREVSTGTNGVTTALTKRNGRSRMGALDSADLQLESPPVLETDQSTKRTALLRQEADYWTVGYQGRVVRLKHLRGLTLIAYLLARPHQEVHSVELAKIADLGAEGVAESVPYPISSSDLGPILDVSAKQSYRQRIQELREALEEARSFNDFERASKIDEEICVITRELARAVGLGGRDRKTGSEVERARLRVTNAIKLSIRKISNQDAALGRFLACMIRTGTFCSYAPDLDQCPDWDL